MSLPLTVEAHLTYRCSLSCENCNRACHLNQTHTPDLTLDQFREAVASAPNVVRIVLIGGEPTLHPDVVEFGRVALTLAPKVLIYSNAHTVYARARLAALATLGIHNRDSTAKPYGSIRHATNPFIAPTDYGMTHGDACTWWGRHSCGYSLDACGWTQCSIGGMIDGILGLGVRSWDWAEIESRDRLDTLCRHCGAFWSPPEGGPELQRVRGQRCSPTWAKAFQGVR